MHGPTHIKKEILLLQIEITLQLHFKDIPIQVWTGPLGLQEVEALRISRQLKKGDYQIVSSTHRPPLYARRHA